MTEVLKSELPRAMLGRYRLISELGSGGMARVYLALASGLAGFTKLVVLKVMRGELAQNPEAQQMFLGEARLAARLSHPNVIQTTEVGEEDGFYFICMEYLEGLPLGILLGRTRAAPLPLAVRLEIACQLLDGLSYLHELSDFDGSPLNLVHRDISPSNVFITFEGTAKVLDFGVAKAEGLSDVSVLGSFKGKFGYAAPEQLSGRYDARSDVFTAGLVIWELLNYRRLSRDRTVSEIVAGRTTGAETQLLRSRATEGLPTELLEICIKAAAPDPEERYQSAAEFRDALQRYMVQHALGSSPKHLQQVLTERFSGLRDAERKRIDEHLKEIQLGDAALLPRAGAGSSSQTPPPWVDSSRVVSSPVPSPAAKTRRLLALASAAALSLLMVAALSEAVLARRGSAVVRDPSSAAAGLARAAPEPASHDAAPIGESAGQPHSLREETVEKLELDRPQNDDHTPTGGAASRLSKPGAGGGRTSTRPRSVPRGVTAGASPSAAVQPGRRQAEPPPGAPERAPLDPADFTPRRPSGGIARPIDSSSPYAN